MTERMVEVQNGRVERLPESLVCGMCGGKSRLPAWQAFAKPDGELLGMVGHADCKRCHRLVVGVLADDAAALQELRDLAEEAFR